MALNIEPEQSVFTTTGGSSFHTLVSLSNTRIAFKVLCSDNAHYSVRPVYGFLEPGESAPFEIKRLEGPAANDTLSFQWAEVPAEETDPTAPFRYEAQTEYRMALNIEPERSIFAASGGSALHNIVSLTDNRIAFKVKSSNNDHYSVRPVYGFLEAGQTITFEIVRHKGPTANDKLVIQWAEVPAEEDDPKAPFQYEAQAGEVILPLSAQ